LIEVQGTASAIAPRPLPWRVASRPAAARGRRRRSRYNVDRRGEWAKVGLPHGDIVISIVNIYNVVKCIVVLKMQSLVKSESNIEIALALFWALFWERTISSFDFVHKVYNITITETVVWKGWLLYLTKIGIER